MDEMFNQISFNESLSTMPKENAKITGINFKQYLNKNFPNHLDKITTNTKEETLLITEKVTEYKYSLSCNSESFILFNNNKCKSLCLII